MTEVLDPSWWQSLYDDIVADIFLVRKDPEELNATVAFVQERLGLRRGSTLLDQCCGLGSLDVPLAQQGVRVLGVDQCAAYIARARREAQALGLDCRFVVADAREFVPDAAVDAVLNWGTSFGNADDGGNTQMLQCAFHALRPGGRLLLDYQHIARVLRQFQPFLVHRHSEKHGETLLVRESHLDLAAGELRQRWTFIYADDRREERASRVKLYLPHTLAAMLTASGFADIEFFGGVRGESLTLDSPRCILVARRAQG